MEGLDLLQAEQLPEASESFLAALDHSPANKLAERQFYRATHLLKYDISYRWARWPFQPPPAPPEPSGYKRKARLPLAPPGKVLALVGDSVGPNHITTRWEEVTLPEDMAETHRLGIEGYELEASETCPLDGLKPMARVYMGAALRFKLDNLLPETAVSFRVRAYNSIGAGEWSEVLQLITEAQEEEEEKIPLSEVPAEWLRIDLEDVFKDAIKQQQLQFGVEVDQAQIVLELSEIMIKFLAPIKITYRYYVLAGASGSAEGDANAMGMAQFANFVKGAQLMAKGQGLSEFDTLFKRAVREMTPARRQSVREVALTAMANKRAAASVEEGKRAAAASVEEGKGAADGMATWKTEDSSIEGTPSAGPASAPAATPAAAPAGAPAGAPPISLKTKVAAAATSAKMVGRKQRTTMAQHHFVGALIRIAAAKFGVVQLAPSLSTLCEHLSRQ